MEKGDSHPSAHLALIQGLSLGFAIQGNLFILGADLSNDAVQVQVPVVVHGQDDGGLTGVNLDLGYLLNWEVRTESGSPNFSPVLISFWACSPGRWAKVEAGSACWRSVCGAEGEGSEEQDTPCSPAPAFTHRQQVVRAIS